MEWAKKLVWGKSLTFTAFYICNAIKHSLEFPNKLWAMLVKFGYRVRHWYMFKCLTQLNLGIVLDIDTCLSVLLNYFVKTYMILPKSEALQVYISTPK